jgi:stress-induced morphogen
MSNLQHLVRYVVALLLVRNAFAFLSPVAVQRHRLVTQISSETTAGALGPVASARSKIKHDLQATSLEVSSTHDDPNGSHITINVVSPLFEGVNRVKRQQMVYKAIWEEMQGAIHAVDSMVCKAPSEID